MRARLLTRWQQQPAMTRAPHGYRLHAKRPHKQIQLGGPVLDSTYSITMCGALVMEARVLSVVIGNLVC